MLIEHATFEGDCTICSADDIAENYVEMFKPCRIASGSGKFDIPETELSVTIQADAHGATFMVSKGGRIGFLNVCCFDDDNTNYQMNIVHTHTERLFKKARTPLLTNWLYTIPIFPSALTTQEINQAIEYALYIYDAILVSRNQYKP